MLWEAVGNEPISHWLMLWSSSGIREARKEIGSTQPHWSKKLRGFRYIGQIRLGRSIAVHVVGKSGFVSHTKHIAEATNMDLFHS